MPTVPGLLKQKKPIHPFGCNEVRGEISLFLSQNCSPCILVSELGAMVTEPSNTIPQAEPTGGKPDTLATASIPKGDVFALTTGLLY